MNMYADKKSFLITLCFSSLFVFGVFRMSYVTVGMVLLLVLFYFWRGESAKLPFKKNDVFFLISIILFVVSFVVSFCVGKGWISIRIEGESDYSGLEILPRYFVCFLIFFLMIKEKIFVKKEVIFPSIAIGGIVIGLVAIWQRCIVGMPRVEGFLGITIMGDISAILMLYNFILFLAIKRSVLYIFVLVLSCSSVILSVARGAMFGVCAMLGFIFFSVILKKIVSRKKIFFISLIVVAIFSFFALFHGGIQGVFRMHDTHSDISRYLKGESNLSIGDRFELWKEAKAMFDISPILGLNKYQAFIQDKQIKKKSGSRLEYFRYEKHNQFLNALGGRGMVGFFAICVLWCAMFMLFVSSLFGTRREVFFIALMPFSMLCYLFLNSFIDDVLEIGTTVIFMLLSITLFYKLILQERECAI